MDVKIRVLFLGTRNMDAGWPHHFFNVDKEISRIKEELVNLQKNIYGIKFFGWDLLASENDVNEISWKLDADGLLIVILTSEFASLGPDLFKLLDSGLPAIIYSKPFSTYWNGSGRFYFERRKAFVVESSDIRSLLPALNALKTVCLLSKTRLLIVMDLKYDKSKYNPRMAEPRWKGKEYFRLLKEIFGVSARIVSFKELLDVYESIRENEINNILSNLKRNANKILVPEKDLVKACRMYVALRKLMERYDANAVTVDCLAGIRENILPIAPCLAFSLFNDEGVPATCEADIETMLANIIIHYLSGRLGFQGDPVIDEKNNVLVLAHCTSPTKIYGYNRENEKFDIVTHSETWRNVGVKTYMPETGIATVFDIRAVVETVYTGWPLVASGSILKGYYMYFDTASIVENPYKDSVRGCRTKIALRLNIPLRDFSDNFYGHHRIVVIGNFVKELEIVSRLLGIKYFRKPYLPLGK